VRAAEHVVALRTETLGLGDATDRRETLPKQALRDGDVPVIWAQRVDTEAHHFAKKRLGGPVPLLVVEN
jgi:hypothetical protein